MSHVRSAVAVTAAAALLTLAAVAGADHRTVHAGAWSYFGDPRSVTHDGRVYTGWIGTDRTIGVEQYDPATGVSLHRHLYRQDERDDHDNPSLAFWRDRLYAFFSPHSGHVYPRGRKSRMRYRVSSPGHAFEDGFGPVRDVSTNTPGGLGFTYPNPIPTGDKLWLFWRGGDWQPTFSYTRDGRRWVRARTLIRGPAHQRPYAKYVGGPDGSIHMVFSEAHPHSYRTSLYYLRYRARRFYAADGTLIGDLGDLPLRPREVDRVYRFSPDAGRAWPHDVALDAAGRPVVVYTRRLGGGSGDDTFFRARPRGTGWESRAIVPAGPSAPTFTSGGITLHHANPEWAVLSRRIGEHFQVELWHTPDDGETWDPPVPITSDTDDHSFRPVIPRDWTDPARLVVYYVHGGADGFRNFRTVIRMDTR